MDKIAQFAKAQLKTTLPEFTAGDIVKVYQKIKEGDKARVQIFEGIVLARKHGKGASASFTVRKIAEGVGVEKTYPLHSPLIEKIEVMKHTKTRRSKLYYIRTAKGKRAKLKSVQVGFATRSAKGAKEAAAEVVEDVPAESTQGE
ncbi:MAG: 50S ribosomal protein L19 [Candidatus Azambacteria bacterium]|nr:50S ribosomal protein L19 [Candidatus Azambacteria bacterium]